MSVTRILLTDAANGSRQDRFGLGPGDSLRLAGSDRWSVSKETLAGGMAAGVEVVTVDNGRLSFSVLPTRGMGLWKASLGNLPVGWQSPAELPVHPAFVPVDAPNGLGWLKGFNELLCRCGLASNGPPGPDPDGHPLENPLTLHGRIANLAANRVELQIDDAGKGTFTLYGVVDEASLFGTNLRLESWISSDAGSNSLTIRDVVTNRSARQAESQLLYHINVGPPFLEAGSKFIAPATEIAPRDARAAEGIDDWQTCSAPETGYAEQVYFAKPLTNDRGESFVLLRNAGGDKGVSVHYRVNELPCLSMWKNTQALADGYVVGLEPGTNYPNHRSYERTQGRVVSLAPGESYETLLRIAIHDRLENIAAFEAIAESQTADRPPTIHRTPRPGWSPT